MQIYYNGNIYPVSGPGTSALAVSRGRVAAVGGDRDILALKKPGDTVFDLRGACVLPGFHDSHCHLMMTAAHRRRIDLTGVKSIDGVRDKIMEYVKSHPPVKGASVPGGSPKGGPAPDNWIYCHRLNENFFPGGALPSAAQLDAILPDRPLVIYRTCGHVACLNSAALAAAGITRDTFVSGGAVDRYSNGMPTGVLRENALGLISAVSQPRSKAEIKSLMREGMDLAASKGLVCVHSNDCDGGGAAEFTEVMRELENENGCKLRVYEKISVDGVKMFEDLIYSGVKRGEGELFTPGCLKLMTDGSMGGRTAYLRADYGDAPGERGIMAMEPEVIEAIVLKAQKEGWQTAMHAIGDGALDACITAVEHANLAYPAALRHRLVHCQVGDMQLYRRLAWAGMTADIQPQFVPSDALSLNLNKRLGKARASVSYAWKSLLELGVVCGGGSDSPVEPLDALAGIHSAVTRQNADGEPVGGWRPEERVTVAEAVHMYTIGGAYAAHMEDRLGTLGAGMLADFTVLGRDILSCPDEEIPHTRIMMTVVNGNVVYRDETY